VYNENTIVILAKCTIIYNLLINMHRKRKRRHFGCVRSQWHSTVFNANCCRIQGNYFHFAAIAVTEKIWKYSRTNGICFCYRLV